MDLLSLVNLFQDRLFTESKVTKASIVLQGESGRVTFPVPPANLPELTLPQNNTTFSSLAGDMMLIGQMGLRTMKLDVLLPDDTSRYTWANGDTATTIINFINRERANYNPLRIVITRGHVTYVNMAVLINNFTYYKDNVGDYHASLDLVEFRTQNPITGELES